MTYTIEEVRRLVPEAKEPWSNGLEVHITIGHKTHGSDSDWGRALLTTRRKLEIAREALDFYARHHHVLQTTAPNYAAQALDVINKEGEL